MDGVISDWVGSAARVFGRQSDSLDWEKDRSSIHIPLGLESEDEMWERIDKLGENFWYGLNPYPWRDELWDYLENIAPVTIATSPSRFHGSASGKIRWLQEWKGKAFRDYIIIPRRKAHLSKPGTVLIDDHERHIKQWRAEGGVGILFPRPWNDNRDRPETPVEYTKLMMKHILMRGL